MILILIYEKKSKPQTIICIGELYRIEPPNANIKRIKKEGTRTQQRNDRKKRIERKTNGKRVMW